MVEDPAALFRRKRSEYIRRIRGVGGAPAGDLDADQVEQAAAFDFEHPAVPARVDRGLAGVAFVGANDRHVPVTTSCPAVGV